MADVATTVNFCKQHAAATASDVQVVSASGDTIPITDHVAISVNLGLLVVTQSFLVEKTLVTSVILGMDFTKAHGF